MIEARFEFSQRSTKICMWDIFVAGDFKSLMRKGEKY